MSLPELSPAGLRLRARERTDMVGSEFVSESELQRYCEAAFQEWLGILGTGYDDLLLRKASVTAFASEDTVQLGAQVPANLAGWTLTLTTSGSASLAKPDGTATCLSFAHSAASGDVVFPLTNLTNGGVSPSPVTVDLVVTSTVDRYLRIEIGSGDRALSTDAAHTVWVNLWTGAIGTGGGGPGASLGITVEQLNIISQAGPDLDELWKRVRVTFEPKGPRNALRARMVTADGGTTAETSGSWRFASIAVFQATPLKKLRGVRIRDGRFLRRKQLRDLEAYSLGGQVFAPSPEGYLLAADNGRDGMPRLFLMPTPTANTTLDYYYVPMFSVEDAAGLSLAAGWDEYVVLTAAIKLRDKEESDPTVLFAEREALVKRMKEDLEPIDAGEPAQVTQFMGTGVDPYSLMLQEEVF